MADPGLRTGNRRRYVRDEYSDGSPAGGERERRKNKASGWQVALITGLRIHRRATMFETFMFEDQLSRT